MQEKRFYHSWLKELSTNEDIPQGELRDLLEEGGNLNKTEILLGRRKGQGWILGRSPTMSATAEAPVTGVQKTRGEAAIMRIIMSSLLDVLHFGSCQTYK